MIGKPKEVKEYEAEDEIQRVYHEIRQTLRVTGINLNFRTWADFDKFLPAMWDDFRPNAETRVFENVADEVRRRAVQLSGELPRTNALEGSEFGESRSWQIQRALDLYHYVNPKLLVLTSAVLASLKGEQNEGESDAMERIKKGEPPTMYAMELVDEKPKDKPLRKLFNDIKKTLSLSSINSDYRTLGLWPDYLQAAWQKLKPVCKSAAFENTADALREESRTLAHRLPYRLSLTRTTLVELGEDADKVIETTEKFEQILPPLILNIALLQLDWKSPEDLEKSPFPAATMKEKEAQYAMA